MGDRTRPTAGAIDAAIWIATEPTCRPTKRGSESARASHEPTHRMATGTKTSEIPTASPIWLPCRPPTSAPSTMPRPPLIKA